MDKSITLGASKSFLKNITDVTSNFLDALKSVVSSQGDISKQTMELIKEAIIILGKQLERDLSEKERKYINKSIFNLIERACKVDERSRKSGKQMLIIGGGVFLVAVGIVILFLTKGKNPQVIQQGGNLAVKGFKNFRG